MTRASAAAHETEAPLTRPLRSPLGVVASGFIIQCVLWGGFYSFGVFLVPMANDLGESRAGIAAVYTMVTLVFGLGSVVAGTLSDRFGPQRVIATCSALAATGYALMALITEPWHAYIALGLFTGIGLTGGYVPVTSTVARWFTAQRGMMLGVVIAGNAVGAMIGPPLLGWLIDGSGWRFAYALLAIAIVLTCLPAARVMRTPSFDDAVPDEPSEAGRGHVAPVRAGPAGRTLVTAAFVALCALWTLHGAVGTGLMVHFAALMESAGAELPTISLVLGLLGALGIVGGLAGGALGDKVHQGRAIAVGFLLCGAAVLLLIVSSSSTAFVAVAVMLGLAWFAIGVLVPLVAARLVPVGQLGRALGWLELLWAVGAGAGPTVLGWIYDRNGDYGAGLWLLLVLSAIAFVAALTLPNDRSRSHRSAPAVGLI